MDEIQTVQVGGLLRHAVPIRGPISRSGNINLCSCTTGGVRSSVFHYPSSSSFEVGKISTFNTYGRSTSSGKILIPGFRVVIGTPVDTSNKSLARGPLNNAFASIPKLDTFRAFSPFALVSSSSMSGNTKKA